MRGIIIEVFGYIGSALVIISMLMTSVVKLRVVNMCGALISTIYAVIVTAWPVAVLNAALIVIQIFQLCRLRKEKQKSESQETAQETK